MQVMYIIGLVLYAIMSSVSATIAAISAHIGSIFSTDVSGLQLILIWCVVFLFWPIILIVALVQGIVSKIKR